MNPLGNHSELVLSFENLNCEAHTRTKHGFNYQSFLYRYGVVHNEKFPHKLIELQEDDPQLFGSRVGYILPDPQLHPDGTTSPSTTYALCAYCDPFTSTISTFHKTGEGLHNHMITHHGITIDEYSDEDSNSVTSSEIFLWTYKQGQSYERPSFNEHEEYSVEEDPGEEADTEFSDSDSTDSGYSTDEDSGSDSSLDSNEDSTTDDELTTDGDSDSDENSEDSSENNLEENQDGYEEPVHYVLDVENGVIVGPPGMPNIPFLGRYYPPGDEEFYRRYLGPAAEERAARRLMGQIDSDGYFDDSDDSSQSNYSIDSNGTLIGENLDEEFDNDSDSTVWSYDTTYLEGDTLVGGDSEFDSGDDSEHDPRGYRDDPYDSSNTDLEGPPPPGALDVSDNESDDTDDSEYEELVEWDYYFSDSDSDDLYALPQQQQHSSRDFHFVEHNFADTPEATSEITLDTFEVNNRNQIIQEIDPLEDLADAFDDFPTSNDAEEVVGHYEANEYEEQQPRFSLFETFDRHDLTSLHNNDDDSDDDSDSSSHGLVNSGESAGWEDDNTDEDGTANSSSNCNISRLTAQFDALLRFPYHAPKNTTLSDEAHRDPLEHTAHSNGVNHENRERSNPADLDYTSSGSLTDSDYSSLFDGSGATSYRGPPPSPISDSDAGVYNSSASDDDSAVVRFRARLLHGREPTVVIKPVESGDEDGEISDSDSEDSPVIRQWIKQSDFES